jgi:predicted transcriptional regulator
MADEEIIVTETEAPIDEPKSESEEISWLKKIAQRLEELTESNRAALELMAQKQETMAKIREETQSKTEAESSAGITQVTEVEAPETPPSPHGYGRFQAI